MPEPISLRDQDLLCAEGVFSSNQNIQIGEHAQRQIPVELLGQHWTLEGHGQYPFHLQPVQQGKQLVGQDEIALAVEEVAPPKATQHFGRDLMPHLYQSAVEQGNKPVPGRRLEEILPVWAVR